MVDRHTKDLFRLARGLCPTEADAEDVLQDTLVAAFRKIGTFDGRASLLTWMSRILVRRARKQWRKWDRRGRTASLDEVLDSPGADSEPPASGHCDAADCRLDLAAALPRLAPEHREVIVLRELQGLSYAEIAATSGGAPGDGRVPHPPRAVGTAPAAARRTTREHDCSRLDGR